MATDNGLYGKIFAHMAQNISKISGINIFPTIFKRIWNFACEMSVCDLCHWFFCTENMNTLSKMGIAPAPEYDAEGKPNPNAGEQGCCGKFCFSLCFCLTGCCFGCFCCCFCFYGMCCGCCCGKCAPKPKIPAKSENPITEQPRWICCGLKNSIWVKKLNWKFK